jgi:hypothetical protein
MDQPAIEKAKARRAITILYVCMAVGVFGPLILYFFVHKP